MPGMSVGMVVHQGAHAPRNSSSARNVRSTVPTPEPGTLALRGLGLAGLGLSRRRKTH